jgi:K+-sensing histidine kinase KdpD
MKKDRLSSLSGLYINSLFALCLVLVMTVPLVLIGRDTLGEAVIALLYLLPVGWSASRWGQGPGLVAAVASALTFDYFFIPPFNTFAVGRLEGWLVLGIFLIVAIVVVGRIQSGLSRARNSEREALFMYELSAALSGMYTQAAVGHALARNLQQMFQAALVEVLIEDGKQVSSLVVKVPSDHIETSKPDRILPILSSPGLIGEIRLWRGDGWLPPQDSRLLNNFANQAALAIERARFVEIEAQANSAKNWAENRNDAAGENMNSRVMSGERNQNGKIAGSTTITTIANSG